MSEIKPAIFESGQMTVRLSEETANLLQKFYKELAGFEPSEDKPPLSGKLLFERVLRFAIDHITGNESSQEQINSLQQANIHLESSSRDLENALLQAQTELDELRSANPGGENGVLLVLNPAIADLVDHCVNKASIKTGKKFTRVDIFMNLFWEAVSTGRASLPVIFSSSEVASIIKKHKEQE